MDVLLFLPDHKLFCNLIMVEPTIQAFFLKCMGQTSLILATFCFCVFSLANQSNPAIPVITFCCTDKNGLCALAAFPQSLHTGSTAVNITVILGGESGAGILRNLVAPFGWKSAPLGGEILALLSFLK
jgi:hypothetical protein